MQRVVSARLGKEQAVIFFATPIPRPDRCDVAPDSEVRVIIGNYSALKAEGRLLFRTALTVSRDFPLDVFPLDEAQVDNLS